MDLRDQLQRTLGDAYTLERELGAGGMATVYLAHDLKHDRRVALKVLRHDVAQTVGAERFLREIRLAAKLSHPHILPLYDSGDAGGALYFVMPTVEGQSLRDRLHATPQLPIEEAVRIATEVAGALDYAHRHGVVHRDIKPENILLHDGHALVADFGIGKALSAVEGEAFTKTGTSIGTPAYMSPEQASGEAVDGRSDIYSLGCVLYEMLVGEPPFTGRTVQAVIAKRFVQTPADVSALREGVSRPVARAVQRALARTPIDRHQTAAELLAVLREVETPADGARRTAPAQSIAVLPFANLSPDPENEYFGDGIAEDIINALARVSGLSVAARTSAFSFKGKSEDLRVVGEKLNVATVLEGSVRKAGSRLRITAQLIAVADGYHLWSERYDRELVDVFAVQDEIATAIANKLQLTFKKPATADASKPTTAEVEAYELTVRGRALSAQRGRSILTAIECFNRAIELAPDSAAAYAGLGNAYRLHTQYGFGTAADSIPKARAALARALELDPDFAEAMGHLAVIALWYDGNAAQGFELWERALALNPRLSEVRALYGVWGLVIAREGTDDDRAAAELARMAADDPLSSICATIRAVGLGMMGRNREAVAEALRARDLDPSAFHARYALAWVQTWARDVDGGFAAVESAIEQFGRHPWLLQVLTGLYMLRGDRVRAEAVHTELTARALTSNVPFFARAVSALYLGKTDEAMEHAMRSVELFDAIGPIWVRFPDTEPLHAHPRYPELRRRMGL